MKMKHAVWPSVAWIHRMLGAAASAPTLHPTFFMAVQRTGTAIKAELVGTPKPSAVHGRAGGLPAQKVGSLINYVGV